MRWGVPSLDALAESHAQYTRRRTYRQKPVKPEQGSRPSPGRDDLGSSQEHLLPITTTTDDGQKITQI